LLYDEPRLHDTGVDVECRPHGCRPRMMSFKFAAAYRGGGSARPVPGRRECRGHGVRTGQADPGSRLRGADASRTRYRRPAGVVAGRGGRPSVNSHHRPSTCRNSCRSALPVHLARSPASCLRSERENLLPPPDYIPKPPQRRPRPQQQP
jgi:hypothetical protein